MEVSNRIADLRKYFPFSLGETTLRTQALSLGKCVKYTAGESVLLSGSPAKHCGLILSGEAVAFKFDGSGRRYQVCLEEGCFIGLEALNGEGTYTSKVVSAGELEILFWNSDGIARLCEYSAEFKSGMRMLDEGRVYQEQWLIPETDVTDPVLCSLPAHWLSIAAPAFLILPLLLIGLGVCGMLIRHYIAAWLLVFGLLAAGGTLLYRQLTVRGNERVIVTSKNLILIPKNNEAEMPVIRLAGLQMAELKQNFFERLVKAGKIAADTEKQRYVTPSLREPGVVVRLIHDYSVISAKGRPLPLRIDGQLAKPLPLRNETEDREEIPEESPEQPAESLLPPFHPTDFHPHWAMLIRMIFKPFLALITALYAVRYFRYHTYFKALEPILLAVAGAALLWIVYQFFTWRNHRFFIEEDCIKDYSKRPFSREDLNMAMNHKIQSVRFEKKGFFQNLLNYGTVYVLAGEGELSFDYVSNPGKVQQLIMSTCNRYERKRQIEEEARRRAYISDLVREIRDESG